MSLQSGESVVNAAKEAMTFIGIMPSDHQISCMLAEEVVRLRAQLKSLAGITESLTGGRQIVVLAEGSITLEPRPV